MPDFNYLLLQVLYDNAVEILFAVIPGIIFFILSSISLIAIRKQVMN
jgi:hypothetical protein